MSTPAIKLGQGSYAKEYCMIDEPEPDGDGLTFFVPVGHDDIEPIHCPETWMRDVADWVLNGGL